MNEQAQILLKEAFKRLLMNYLGSIEEKPIPELRAWSLALLELAHECREQMLEIEDSLLEKAQDKVEEW